MIEDVEVCDYLTSLAYVPKSAEDVFKEPWSGVTTGRIRFTNSKYSISFFDISYIMRAACCYTEIQIGIKSGYSVIANYCNLSVNIIGERSLPSTDFYKLGSFTDINSIKDDI